MAVVDTGTPCHVDRKSLQVLQDKERRKRGKYQERVEAIGGTFTPLACSVYGTLAPEAAKVLTLTVNGLDEERPEKASTAKMLRVALQVAIVKASSLCLRARARTVPPSCAEPQGLEDCMAALSDSRPPREDVAGPPPAV